MCKAGMQQIDMIAYLVRVSIISFMLSKPAAPSLYMYPRLLGSDAPVALLYRTLALGSKSCKTPTAFPV